MLISGYDGVVNCDPIISAIGHEGSWRFIQLLQQGFDMRGVINVLVGQIGRDDFAAIGVDAYMQFAPGAALCCAVLFKQPFARAAQFQSRAIDNQVKRARCSGFLDFVNLQSTRPSAQR